MYVVDISDEERLEENYETIRKVFPDTVTTTRLQKPLSHSIADLNESGTAQGQMIFITHVNQYKGELDNAKYPPPMVTKRPQRQVNLLLAQFCTFIDKIIEHYVFLSEGVHTAEMELKVRQQTERDERRLRLMRQEQDRVYSAETLLTTLVTEEPQLSNVEEEEEENHPESRPKTASTSPSVSDTQSPPLPPLRNADIFTVEGSKELYTVFPEAPAIEKHLRRMRRIQAGLRRRAEEMKMKNDELQLESL
ncbi:hypothetical protein COOONC_16200 [Cooperia oncophora]